MGFAVAPNQSAVLKALGDFLAGILPAGTPIIVGQQNRVGEPKAGDFVVMTPTRRGRLATNEDDYVTDITTIVGSIAGTTLTIYGGGIGEFIIGVTPIGYSVASDAVAVGTMIQGLSVVEGTVITAFDTGTGGDGTYEVNIAQNVAIELMNAGGEQQITQATQIDVQIDVHGPLGGDNAQIISTLLRDDYAVQKFMALGDDAVPLYADDPRQIPFINSQQQYEDRWIVQASVQVNEIVTIPQQFADAVTVTLIDVDAVYPPSA